MNPIIPSMAIAAMIVCASFGFAEVLRWGANKTWALHPRKLLLPALGTGSAFALLGVLLMLPFVLLTPGSASTPAPSGNEIIGVAIILPLISYIGWLSLIMAHQAAKGWTRSETLRVIGRSVLPALVSTAIFTALLFSLF